jgi:hypothetical protein
MGVSRNKFAGIFLQVAMQGRSVQMYIHLLQSGMAGLSKMIPAQGRDDVHAGGRILLVVVVEG